MKAPTADYSPISQAIKANTNAISSMYSAADAENWSNRYELSKKSLDIQAQNLDIQKENNQLNKEAISDSKSQNNWNFGLQMAQLGLSAAETIIKSKQTEISSQTTDKASKAGSEFSAQMQLHPEWSSAEKNDRGYYLTQEGQDALDSIVNSYFPEGTKYGWGMDKTVNQIRQNVMDAGSILGIQTEASKVVKNIANAYTANSNSANINDVQTGSTVSVQVPDGMGGTTSVTVGSQRYSVIESMRGYYGDTWADTELKNASTQYQAQRASYLETSIVDAINNNEEINTITSMVDTADEFIKTINDPISRSSYKERLTNSFTQAIYDWKDAQLSSISDYGEERYDGLVAFKGRFAEGGTSTEWVIGKDGKLTQKEVATEKGDLTDLFSSEYVLPGTLSAIRSDLASRTSQIEDQYGTVRTAQVQSGITAANAQYERDHNATAWGNNISQVMTSVYGNGWQGDNSALTVYTNALEKEVKSSLGELSKNSIVSTELAITLNNLKLGGKFDDLSSDQQEQVNLVTAAFMKDVETLLLHQPDLIKDPISLQNSLKSMRESYNEKWLSKVMSGSSTATTGFWSSTTGFIKSLFTGKEIPINEGYSEANEYVGSTLKITDNAFGKEFANAVSEDGYMSISDVGNWQTGTKDTVATAITNMGSYISQVQQAPVQSSAGALVKYDMKTGEVSGYRWIADKTSLIHSGLIEPDDNSIYWVDVDANAKPGKDKIWNVVDQEGKKLGSTDELKPTEEDIKFVEENVGKDAAEYFSEVNNSEARKIIMDNFGTPMSNVMNIISQATTPESFDELVSYYEKDGIPFTEDMKSKIKDLREKKFNKDYYSVAGYGQKDGYVPPQKNTSQKNKLYWDSYGEHIKKRDSISKAETAEDESTIKSINSAIDSISNDDDRGFAKKMSEINDMDELEREWNALFNSYVWDTLDKKDKDALDKVHALRKNQLEKENR